MNWRNYCHLGNIEYKPTQTPYISLAKRNLTRRCFNVMNCHVFREGQAVILYARYCTKSSPMLVFIAKTPAWVYYGFNVGETKADV